ncbi:nucleotidyltransferase domain-containing protein [Candidatus Calescamantes bacterium]|nr:nucleotidyltransferase domain-containing protein [Candidatus Calescamantes bacterium]
MVTERDKIIQELKDLIATLEKAGILIKRAYLFGSYARGTPKKWSDIDLLLVSDNFSGIRFYDIEKLIPLTRRFNSLIELHPFKTEDFNLKDLFIKEITETGIRIK